MEYISLWWIDSNVKKDFKNDGYKKNNKSKAIKNKFLIWKKNKKIDIINFDQS